MSWTIVLFLGGAAYWYYAMNDTRRGPRGRPATRASGPSKVKDKPRQTYSEVASKAAPKAARKSVEKAVQEVGGKVEAALSAASSTAGMDADDDLSPAGSPVLAATNPKGPSGRDVSDMLVSSGGAPSVLRLTPANEPSRPKKQTEQRAAPTQETKKQRQNKKKAELAKAQREEDEKQRLALKEQQMRTARIARGEPAKNGLRPANQPASNAWNKLQSDQSTASSDHTVTPAQNGQLLDTFDNPDSSSEINTNGTSGTASLESSMHWVNMPSEEEQMRLVREMDSQWQTVPKGKKGRKKPNATGETPSEHDSESNVPLSPVKKTPTRPVENIQPQSQFDVLRETAPQVSHPLDSDWPVV